MAGIQQADFEILEALFRAGGSASPDSIRTTLNGHSIGSVGALRSRLGRLCLRGYVVKNGPEYDLTVLGRESFLDELGWREPESPVLVRARQRKAYVLSAEVERLDEGGFLASCPEIQGCHAEGATVAEALENLEDAARVLLDLHPPKDKGRSVRDELRPGRLLKAEFVLSLPA